MPDPVVEPPNRHKLGIIALLGLVSGLPWLLTGSTLMTRMRVEHVDIAVIGFFGWAHLPYTFKFVWAPFLDRYHLPWLGRRRGWMLVCQLSLVVGIATLGLIEPTNNINILFAVALTVAICSATLDIAIDAYRTEVLEEHERGAGGAVFVTGYRAAIVIAGAGVLVLADFIPWSVAYLVIAGLMLLSILITFITPRAPIVNKRPRSFRQAAIGPMKDLAGRSSAVLVLVFLLLYKLGEGIAGHMIHPFLIDVGFSSSAVGAINKGVGLPAAVAGTLLGGVAVNTLGVHRSLLWFGILMAAPNLLYAVQSQAGPDHGLLALVVVVDQFCNGLAAAALVVFLMSLCDRRFTAFQYAALFSATSVVGAVAKGWSGVFQKALGWEWFFIATALASIPALLVLLTIPADAGLPKWGKAPQSPE